MQSIFKLASCLCEVIAFLMLYGKLSGMHLEWTVEHGLIYTLTLSQPKFYSNAVVLKLMFSVLGLRTGRVDTVL